MANSILLPAPAGMIPPPSPTPKTPRPSPRTRGDDPIWEEAAKAYKGFSPHPRG